MFRRLAWVSAQTEVYRDRFVELGVPANRVVVGGSLKWDAALKVPDAREAEELAVGLGIDRDRPLIVAGSTGPGEEGGAAARFAPEVSVAACAEEAGAVGMRWRSWCRGCGGGVRAGGWGMGAVG